VVLRTVLERLELRAVRPQSERPRVRHVTAVPGRDAEVVAGLRMRARHPAAATAAGPAVTAH